jgi:integrase
LASAPGPWLFPNGRGERRNTTSFATMISGFILRETGIQMNVHLFRHLAAKLHLEAHPEDIETARRVLSHSSTTTTLRSYADLENTSAFRRYDDMIASKREQLFVPPKRRRG